MLSRQQIREKKRQLEKAESVKRSQHQTLQELNDAERLLEQKKGQRQQMGLQMGSLCVAFLSQVPEHRTGVGPTADKCIRFIDGLIDMHTTELTAVDPPDEDDDDDEDDAEQEAIAV